MTDVEVTEMKTAKTSSRTVEQQKIGGKTNCPGGCDRPTWACACPEPPAWEELRLCPKCGSRLVIDDTSGLVYCEADSSHYRRSEPGRAAGEGRG